MGIPLRSELPRIDNFIGKFREFVMFYDSVTTQIGQSYECLADLPGWIRLGLHEYGKIQLRYTKLY